MKLPEKAGRAIYKNNADVMKEVQFKKHPSSVQL
jgi:hypothetical protein